MYFWFDLDVFEIVLVKIRQNFVHFDNLAYHSTKFPKLVPPKWTDSKLFVTGHPQTQPQLQHQHILKVWRLKLQLHEQMRLEQHFENQNC